MRVTLVSPFDPHPGPRARGNGHAGGVERVFAEFSRNLARRGHDVNLICSTDGPRETAERDGVVYVREPRRFTVMRSPVARLARRIPSDSHVVHVPATYPFTTPDVLRRAKRLGLRSVLDFHFEPAPGTFAGRVAAALYRHVGPRAYSLADAVLVRSYAYGRSAKSLAAVEESLWREIPNGVDTRRFRPNGRGSGDYLLFVGRLVPYKGLSVLLKALYRWPPGLPLFIAGEGPLRSKLERLSRRLGVDVRFLGHVADEDLPALYRGASLTVLPSVTRQEAFGMTLLESMACGTPVVASALPGVEQLADEGGVVARPSDPDDLGHRIVTALTPDTLVRGAPLAERIHRSYSWDAVTDRLVGVYEQVLGWRGATVTTRGSEVNKIAGPGSNPLL